MTKVLTPWNDPFFYQTLHGVLPPSFSPNENLVLDSDSGILKELDSESMRDYLFGGQYEVDLETGVYTDG